VAPGYPLVGRFATGFATLRLPHATANRFLLILLLRFQCTRDLWVGVTAAQCCNIGAHPTPHLETLAKRSNMVFTKRMGMIIIPCAEPEREIIYLQLLEIGNFDKKNGFKA
jgi:hypothetical protein